jgi:hypothetical protein
MPSSDAAEQWFDGLRKCMTYHGLLERRLLSRCSDFFNIHFLVPELLYASEDEKVFPDVRVCRAAPALRGLVDIPTRETLSRQSSNDTATRN